jgi:hypothetical protein
VKRLLRPLVWRVAPHVIADRDRRYQQGVRERAGLPARALELVAEQGDTVASGPFAGLRYPAPLLRVADAPLAKLQGMYEQPLHDAFASAIHAAKGSSFVDLGCADGYYAAGMAVAAGCEVVAFDLARSAREATEALAKANGVAVFTRARATERAVLELAPRTGALLCDIEGGEMGVLTDRAAAALAHALVIVELHGDAARQVLPERFRKTHRIEILDADPGAVEEMRTSAISWLVARPGS